VLSEFNLSVGQAGLATGLFVFGVLSSRFFSAALMNRIGFKRMQVLGILTVVIVSCGYFFVHLPVLLFLVRFFNGFGFGVVSTANTTVISSIIPRNRSGEGIGYFTMFQMLCMAFGPFAAISLLKGSDFRAVFAFCTILPAIGLALLPFLNYDRISNSADSLQGGRSGGKAIDLLVERRVLPVVAMTFLLMVFYMALLPFLPLYAAHLGLSAAAAYFFFVQAGLLLATRPLVSKLFDRKGAAVVILPAVVILSCGFLILSRAQNMGMLFLAAGLLGMGGGAVQNVTMSTAVKIVPRERLSVANATYYMGLDTTVAVAPIVGGALIPLAGYSGMYAVACIVSLLGIPAYYLLLRKKAAVQT
ncbi:MAG: MFS transporter, partial [Clostridiales Family XIII bacterium]|nr:MFS transporter [Clostridiales Family XIII bacterium]